MTVRILATRAGLLALAGFLALNALAFRHAWAFTHFGPAGPPLRVRDISFGQKARLLVVGADIPRPRNEATPAAVGLRYERHVFAGGRGIPLEAWLVPADDGRGTIVLFHGHSASKDSLLREAAALHQMGWSTLLVDFFGSGGSGGRETTIGFYEALDVTAAFRYARALPGAGPVVLYGASMGAAAILKAVADDGLDPAALVLECPYDSLIGTVRHRFTERGLPSFPSADLVVFWGGVIEGFDGFALRPIDAAARIDRPTLLMSGGRDPYVRPEEARALFGALRGRKELVFFPGVGHDSCLRGEPARWKPAVAAFLGAMTAKAAGPVLSLPGVRNASLEAGGRRWPGRRSRAKGRSRSPDRYGGLSTSRPVTISTSSSRRAAGWSFGPRSGMSPSSRECCGDQGARR